MAEIALFHSVLGIRQGVHDAAERFRWAGHKVHVIDLYDGVSFDDYGDAEKFVESVGGPGELMRRTAASLEGFPSDLVYAGFSNGAGSAILAGVTRPGARGVLAYHGALPLQLFGAEAWPADVPLQVHYAEKDPFCEQEWVDQFAASVNESGASYEHFVYPGLASHLFTDSTLPSEYDEQAAELLFTRSLSFLERTQHPR